MKTIRIIFGVLFVVFGVCQLAARADTPVLPTLPPATQPTAQAGFDADQLGKMIEGLGYAPKAYKNNDGDVTGYGIEISDSTGNWYMNFDLSKDGKHIWVSMNLAEIKDWKTVPAETLANLLKQNEQSDAYPYFAMYNDNMLVLELNESTGTLTPQWLREDIQIVLDMAKKTQNLWSEQALGQVQPASTPPSD